MESKLLRRSVWGFRQNITKLAYFVAATVLFLSTTLFTLPPQRVHAIPAIDVFAPDVEITNPAQNDVLAGTVEIRASYDDANPDYYQLTITDNSKTTTFYDSGQVPVTANFTDQVIYNWDTTTLVDGTYRINLEGFDQSDNSASHSVKVDVDNPPSLPTGLTIYSGHNASGAELTCSGITNNPQITIDWNANPEGDIDFYYFGVDNSANTDPYHAQTNDTFYNGNITPGIGPYNYTVIAVDDSGQESPIANCGPFTFDNTAPVVDITAPADLAVVNGTVEVRGSVTDENPSEYTVTVRDSGSTVVATSGTVSQTTSISDQPLYNWDTSGHGEGTYIIELTATDAAGNTSSTDTVTVTVDHTAPIVTITQPAANTTHIGLLTVSGSVTDNLAGVGTVTVSLVNDDTAIANNYTATYDSSDDSYSVNIDTTVLDDGSYTINVVASDLATPTANTSAPMSVSDIVIDNVDNTAPSTGGGSGGTPAPNDNDGQVQGVSTTNQPSDNGDSNLSFLLGDSSNDTQDEDGQVQGVNELFSQVGDNADDGIVDKAIKDSDNITDGGCFEIVGICWYWWIIPIVLLFGYIYYRQRGADES